MKKAKTLAEHEREIIQKTLVDCNFKVNEACRILDVTKVFLLNKMIEYDIQPFSVIN
jgi:DNA-binding NtrC family response regulator